MHWLKYLILLLVISIILYNFTFAGKLTSRQIIQVILIVIIISVIVKQLSDSTLVEKFQNYCRALMSLQSCWDVSLLPTSTPTISITPTVPLVLPKSELPLYYKQKKGEIDCTSDLECDYPLKCCYGRCKEPMIVEKLRNDSLFAPQRIKVCPPLKIFQKCSKDLDCKSSYLACREGKCQASPVYFNGGFTV